MLAAIESLDRSKNVEGFAACEASLLESLARLDDRRIAAALIRRVPRGAVDESRRRWAAAALALGESDPVRSLARDVAAGRCSVIKTSEDPDNPVEDIAELVFLLQRCRIPETEEALVALTQPTHLLYPAVRDRLLRAFWTHGFDQISFRNANDVNWKLHPFCVNLLRQALNDRSPTALSQEIKDGLWISRSENSASTTPVPPQLSNVEDRWEYAELRVCDRAAELLSILVRGAPRIVTLRRDADKAREELTAYLNRYRFRPCANDVSIDENALGCFEPDISPSPRTATAEDVAGGRAFFTQGGSGRPLPIAGVVWVRLKEDSDEEGESLGRIVQAELTAEGSALYAVLLADRVAVVHENEIARFVLRQD